jgi:O-antigen/teichoic acid export membrane protein
MKLDKSFNKNKLFTQFFFDTSFLALSSIFSRGILFLRDIYLATYLGPIFYGSWTQILVILSYLLHLPLGFQHLLSRDLPFALGQKQSDKISLIQNATFNITILLPLLLAVLFSIIPVILGYNYMINSYVFYSFLITFLLQQWYVYYSVLLRAYQQFKHFSIGFALLPLINTVLIYYIFEGIFGAIISLGISYFLINIYWFYIAPWKPKMNGIFNIKIKVYLDYFKIAFPLFLSGLLGIILTSVDRLVISFYYSPKLVGTYGFAFIIAQSLSLLISPINQVLFPRIMKQYGLSQSTYSLKKHFVFLTLMLSMLLLFVISFLYFYSIHIMSIFFPAYTDSVTTLKILLISGVFMVLYGGANTISIAIMDHKKVLKIQFFIALVQIISILMLSILNFNMNYISISMLFGSFINAVISMKAAGERMFVLKSEYWDFFTIVIINITLSVISIIAIDLLIITYFNSSIIALIFGNLIWVLIFAIQVFFLFNKIKFLTGYFHRFPRIVK